MKIAILGTGYVGLVTGACFAETGNEVACIDTDRDKVARLNDGKIPFYEPGLAEIVQRNAQGGRLRFSADFAMGTRGCPVVFVCVGTPSLPDGAADLSQVFAAVEQIARSAPDAKVVVIKSTVPVGTADAAAERIAAAGRSGLDVVSNPEFLREGSAVSDCLLPDRVVIGTARAELAATFRDLYTPYVRTGNPILVMDRRSAELAKYAGNAFLAMRIAFVNEMARLCENLGADVRRVREAMGADHRIGMQYLFPSIGFGGSCFPKDVRALRHLMQSRGLSPFLLEATLESNEFQKRNFVDRVVAELGGAAACAGKRVAVWGIAFKAKTDDIRESASLTVIDALLERGIGVTAFDPEAMENARRHYGARVSFAVDAYAALEGADALCVLTEWNQFRFPDFARIKSSLRRPLVCDGRNLYDPDPLVGMGFRYLGIGRAGA